MKSLITLALCALPLALAAEQTNYGSASVAAPWLMNPTSARQAAMAGAGAALSGDPAGQALNPAGLAGLTGQQAAFLHNASFQGQSGERLGYGIGLMPGLGLAAGFDYISFGTVDKYKMEGGSLVADGSLKPSAWHLDLGAGWLSPVGVAVGINVKALNQTLVESSSAWGFDAGGLYTLSGTGLSLGLSGQNIGSKLEGSNLPRNLKAGVAYRLSELRGGQDGANLALDYNLPWADRNGGATLSVAGEYLVQKMFAARLGYKALGRQPAGFSGLNLGFGLAWEMFSLDYAWSAKGELGNENLVQLGAKF